jgi:proline iminopeptidase
MFENRCSTLWPNPSWKIQTDDISAEEIATTYAVARIEAHYFQHKMFLDDGALLQGAKNLGDIPIIIVQGRYDVICPPVTALRLHHVLPSAKLVMVADAGHSAFEPGIASALITAMDDFALIT